jgi:hypothetical protein
MRTLLFATLVFASLPIVACTPPTVASGPSADQGCADEAYDRCSHLQTCSPTAVLERYGDETTCETVVKQNCTANAAAPSTGATPAGAEACAQAFTNWACSDFLYFVNPPPECQTSTGQLAQGAACAFPAQCQSGFCAIAPGSPCGTCAPAPHAGDSCAQLVTCGIGLTCTNDTLQCEPYANQGDACGTGMPCLDGLDCAGGTCQPEVATQGAPCTTHPGCDFYAGLTCDTQSQQCVAVQLAGNGQPCGAVNGQGVSCNAGLCVESSGSSSGTCVAYAQLGAPCDLASGPGCMTPARCIVSSGSGTSTAGVCAVPDATVCH